MPSSFSRLGFDQVRGNRAVWCGFEAARASRGQGSVGGAAPLPEKNTHPQRTSSPRADDAAVPATLTRRRHHPLLRDLRSRTMHAS